jgi:hypothetical protein
MSAKGFAGDRTAAVRIAPRAGITPATGTADGSAARQDRLEPTEGRA